MIVACVASSLVRYPRLGFDAHTRGSEWWILQPIIRQQREAHLCSPYRIGNFDLVYWRVL